MIDAATASQNVLNFQVAQYKKVEEKVMSLIEEMGESIEFYSKSGISTIGFSPYQSSRFPTDYELETASKILTDTFEKYGYTIEKNIILNNVFKIKW